MNRVIKNFSYTLLSNIISLLISALITFIVPKVLGIEMYSYFQLYLFYVNYTGFLHFGWADGVYLRYGGSYYEKLDKPKFSGQFWLLFCVELIIGLAVCGLCQVFVVSVDKKIIFTVIGISIFIHLPRTLLQYILQGTNQIKEYAALTIYDKLTYLLIVICAMLLHTESYVPMIVADLAGKTVALIYAMYQCRDIILSKTVGLKRSLAEARENIKCGIKLMFATLASMLIIGIVRFSIENQWDVSTFGKVSLTMSVSNLLMVFIRAVAMIMFPMLRRMEQEKYSHIYAVLRTCLMTCLLGVLVFYYPMKVILSSWLPQYADSLEYMAILFPMCIFESKMSMLIETYIKTLRKERELLIVNAATVFLSIVTTIITAYGLHDLDLAVGSILFLLVFRCLFAEYLLSKVLDVAVKKDMMMEVFLTVIFVWSSWSVGGLTGLMIYVIAYLVYLFLKRKEIMHIVRGAYNYATKKRSHL